jgi:uncharacterized protein (DUF1015 family)
VPPSSDHRSAAAATGLEVRPFRALTYHRRDPEHLARVSSPAYDLVTSAGRDRLADADPHNVVRLILPLTGRPTGDVDDPARRPAEQAAATLRQWISTGVLVRDPDPALWLYELSPPDGAPVTTGWLGAVALPPTGSAAVLPHEDTCPGAVEGRRELLAGTATDLEPIVLAHDPHPTVTELTDVARRGPTTLELRDADGVGHRLWRVTEPSLLARLADAWGETSSVIADGHHRFAAAEANARAQPRRPGSDAVLALVTPMGRGGLRVDPIHRVVPDLGMDAAVTSAAVGFLVEEMSAKGPADVRAAVRHWLGAVGHPEFLITDGHRVARLSRPSADMTDSIPREAPSAWRELDVVLAHHGLLGRLWKRGEVPDAVLIAHTVAGALALAADRSGVAVLLRAPSPDAVATVARAGVRMPRKSTLFVPKPRTGLVLRPLAD